MQRKFNGAGSHYYPPRPDSYSSYQGSLPPPNPMYTLGSNASTLSQPAHNVSGLNFEMWVCPPPSSNDTHNINSQLHNYTRMQNGVQPPSRPLEDIKDWRLLFPELAPLLESHPDPTRCDIILLDASFRLMSDHPPSGSKLGINLELDFTNPATGDYSAVTGFQQWTCTTSIYQHGERPSKPTHYSLPQPQKGKVTPPFESSWWATRFTRLTERRKRAEDSGSQEEVSSALEHNRASLRSLTAMQELRATPLINPHDPHPGRVSSQRMAILLWRFEQAQKGFIGTTSWQRLIPPPDRMTTNSPPPPPEEMSMGPMVMDSMMQNGQAYNDPNDQYLDQSQHHYSMYSNDQMGDDSQLMDESAYDIFRADDVANYASFQSAFDLPPSQATDSGSLHGAYDLGGSQQYEPNRSDHLPDDRVLHSSANMFEQHPQHPREDHSQHMHTQYSSHHLEPQRQQQPPPHYEPSREPPQHHHSVAPSHHHQHPQPNPHHHRGNRLADPELSSTLHTTHNVLQAQLSTPVSTSMHPHSRPHTAIAQDTNSYDSRSFAAAAAMNDLSQPSISQPPPGHPGSRAHTPAHLSLHSQQRPLPPSLSRHTSYRSQQRDPSGIPTPVSAVSYHDDGMDVSLSAAAQQVQMQGTALANATAGRGFPLEDGRDGGYVEEG